MRNLISVLAAAAAFVTSAACTVHDTSIPPATGPSQLSTSLRLTKTGGTGVQADASGSVGTTGTATVVSYTFFWGDGAKTGPTATPVQSHTYPALVLPATNETFTVTVGVVDSSGLTNSASQTVTFP